jgi:polycomb group RING finger protein 3
MPCPKDLPQVPDNDEALEKMNEAHQETDYHRQDEQVNVCLECISNNLKHLKRRFIRCSSQATITHLKKFIAKKVLNGMDKYRDVSVCHLVIFFPTFYLAFLSQVDILCNDELLGKDHTLKFVYVTRWRFKDPPLRLQYRPKIDL